MRLGKFARENRELSGHSLHNMFLTIRKSGDDVAYRWLHNDLSLPNQKLLTSYWVREGLSYFINEYGFKN